MRGFIRKWRERRKEKRGKETQRQVEDRREEGDRRSPACPKGTPGRVNVFSSVFGFRSEIDYPLNPAMSML